MKEFDVFSKWIKFRPSLEAVIAMVTGSSFAYYLIRPNSVSGPTALCVALFFSYFVFRIKDLNKLRLLALLTFSLAGFGLASCNISRDNSFETMGKTVVHATVKRLLSSGEHFRVLLMEDGCLVASNIALGGYGRLILRNNPIKLSAGDRVSFRSSLRKPSNRGNPGEYDWEIECLNEGIVWLASSRDADSLAILRRGSPYSPSTIVYNLRQSMLAFIDLNSGRFIETAYSGPIRAVLKGIVLGDRGEISPEINRSFSDSGLVHTFSASGVHVTIVGLMAFFVMKSFFHIRPKWLLKVSLPAAGSLAAIPIVSIYCVLVGFKPPSMRAVIMGLVLAVSILGQKRWDSLNTLAFASFIIIMIYPLSFLTASFQLSFAAAAGIVILVRSDVRAFTGQSGLERPGASMKFNLSHVSARAVIDFLRRPLMSVMVVTVAATIATGPIIVQLFQRIPLWSVFSNLVAEFPLSLGLTFGLVATVLGMFSPDLGALILAVAEICVWLVILSANFFSSLPWAVVHIPDMGSVGFIFSVFATCLFFLLLRMPSRKTLLSLCFCLGCVVFFGLVSYIQANLSGTITATFLNVGNGDAAFVRPPQTNGFLVDGGPRTEFFDAGQSIIIPFFLRKSVYHLDAIFVSHPQADHIGGLYAAMGEAPAPVIFMNQINNYSERLFKSQILSKHKEVSFKQADRASPIVWIGDSKLTFINSAPNRLIARSSNADVNNCSLAMRLDYHDFSALFLGDLEKLAEQDLLTSGVNLKAVVLKVAHHGGKTSATSDRLLQEINPKIAIISADYPPRGGIPNLDVVDRLKRTCSKVYWTGRDGAVTISSSGAGPTKVFLGKSHLTEIID